jgi:hypothetical protein
VRAGLHRNSLSKPTDTEKNYPYCQSYITEVKVESWVKKIKMPIIKNTFSSQPLYGVRKSTANDQRPGNKRKVLDFFFLKSLPGPPT